MTHKNYNLIIVALFAVLVTVSTANAGLISLLSKAGKAVNKVDVDVPIAKIELPENTGDYTPASIKPTSSGQWELKSDNGSRLSFDDLLKRDEGNKNKPVLILEAANIPNDFSMFNNIPESLPIFIRGKSGKVFEFQRGTVATLKYKGLRLRINNINELKDGVWHLQRPAMSTSVRMFQLDGKVTRQVPEKVYGSKTTIEKVAGNILIDLMRSMRRQTVVISAPVRNGRLQSTGSSVSINQLQKSASENDITLIIIDSDRPAKLLKSFVKSTDTDRGSVNALYNSTGDFFDKFRDPNNPAELELSLSNSGNSQSLIQLKSRNKPSSNKVSSQIDIGYVTLHALSKTVSVYRPDQERNEELQHRIFPWLHSDIHLYLIASTVLGFMAISTSWSLWKKVWLVRRRTEYAHFLIFGLAWIIHRLLFVVIFIPVFGLFCFIYAIIRVIVKVVTVLFVNPVRWVIRKVAG